MALDLNYKPIALVDTSILNGGGVACLAEEGNWR